MRLRFIAALFILLQACAAGEEAASEKSVVPDTSFERPPYLMRATVGGIDLVLVGAHSKPDAAVAEANFLDDVMTWALEKHGVTNALLLGDLNLACDYAGADELAALDLRKDSKYRWLVPDSADTNVSTETACAYDRVIVIGDGLATVADATVTSDPVPVYSDHFLVSVSVGGATVAAWNVKQYGETEAADTAAVQEMADAICAYDVLLVQEIVASETAPADALLAAAREKCGADVDMHLSEPGGTTSYKERFAFFVHPSKISVVEAYLFAQAASTAAETAPAAAPDPAPAPEPATAPAPAPAVSADCGASPYVTPGGYCYATKDGSKKRVADSCCGI